MLSGVAQSHPLLASIKEAARQWGGIGSTATYATIKRHKVQLVRLGGRSLVPWSEIERVVAEIIPARPADASEKAKSLATRSVEARRARRGAAIAQAQQPHTTRHKRRGSTAA